MGNVLFSFPHSSLVIPSGLEDRINIQKKDLVVSMDFGTDCFFSGLDSSKLFSEIHLFFGNLNRHISGKHLATGEIYDEDNGLFVKKNISTGQELYKYGQELTKQEEQKLLELYYTPYYKKLTDFIISGKIDFLVDVHSCDPVSSGNQFGKGDRADIILGNRGDKAGFIKDGRDFVTFDYNLINELKLLLERYGLTVSLNFPFSGGNITQQFGNPEKSMRDYGRKIDVLQIEVNKRLFMTEDLQTVRINEFKKINGILEESIRKILSSN